MDLVGETYSLKSICLYFKATPHMLKLRYFFTGTRLGQDFLALISLAFITFLLFHSVLAGWWRFDDTMLLKHILEFSPWEYFFVPDVWQQLTAANLTPWLLLSFDFDLTFWGLNPKAFYIHQLIIVWLAACSIYLLLRLWTDSSRAALGACLFIIGVPVMVMAQQLMTRHYLEGLIFAVLALYFFIRSLRTEKYYLAWQGGGLFLLAVTAKEVYVPLAVILSLLPERNFRDRIRHAIPYFLVVGLYIIWRWYMLGVLVGGYGNALEYDAIGNLPFRIGDVLFGTSFLGNSAKLIVLTGLIFLLWRNRRSLPLILFIFASVTIPLTSIAGIVGNRHLITTWLVLSCALVLIWNQFQVSDKKVHFLAVLFLTVILSGAFLQASKSVSGVLRVAQAYETQGKFVVNAKPSQAIWIVPPLSKGLWFIDGLLWIQNRTGKSWSSPQIILDEVELQKIDTDKFNIWQFDQICQCMRDVTASIPATLERWSAKHVEESLSVKMQYVDNIVSWEFGPYQNGAYFLIENQHFGKRRLPKSDRRRIALERFSFYLRYDAPEGWVTYSPLLEFVPSAGPLVWQR